MITAVVIYRLPATISRADCLAHFQEIAPGFSKVPGLLRKQFIWNESGRAGGIYLWERIEDAKKFYEGEWLNGILHRYGNYPQIEYFTNFAIFDAATGESLIAEEA